MTVAEVYNAFLDVKRSEAAEPSYAWYRDKLDPFYERFATRAITSITYEEGHRWNHDDAITPSPCRTLADAIEASPFRLSNQTEQKALDAVVKLLRQNRGLKVGWRWGDESNVSVGRGH